MTPELSDYQKRKEYFQNYHHTRYQNNKEYYQKLGREYYAKNREQCLARERKRHIENPNISVERGRRRRERHKDACNEINRKWREKYPEKQRAGALISGHPELFPLNDECDFCGSWEKLEHGHIDYEYPDLYLTVCHRCNMWMEIGKAVIDGGFFAT